MSNRPTFREFVQALNESAMTKITKQGDRITAVAPDGKTHNLKVGQTVRFQHNGKPATGRLVGVISRGGYKYLNVDTGQSAVQVVPANLL